MSYLMQTISVSYNPAGITHYRLDWTSRYIIPVEYEVNIIFPGLVRSKRYVVSSGCSGFHVDRDIPYGASALDSQFPQSRPGSINIEGGGTSYGRVASSFCGKKNEK